MRDQKISRLAFVAAMVAACTASPALPQDNTFEFGVELDARHDSNVVSRSRQRLQEGDLSGSDQIISPSVFINLTRSSGQNQIRISGLVGYDFYLQNSQLNSERISADIAGVVRALGICEFEPRAQIQRRQAQLGDRFIEIQDPTLNFDNVQTIQSYNLDAACGSAIGLRAIGGIGYERGDNSNELRARSDYERMIYRAGVGYEQPNIGAIDVWASKESTEYDNRLADGMANEYDVRRFGASFERDIGARLNGTVSVFYIDLDAPGTDTRDLSGTGWNVNFGAIITPRLQGSLTFGRDVQPVLNNDALYQRQTLGSVNLSYAANDFVTVSGGYSVRDRDYVYSDLLPPDPLAPLTEDRIHQVTTAVEYDPPGPLGFTAYGGYERRDADEELFEYDGFYVGLRARYVFTR